VPAGGQSVPNDGHYGVWSARREVFDDVALREGAGSRDFPLKGEPGSGGDRRISINQAPVEPTT
jgi:hypothetical protein